MELQQKLARQNYSANLKDARAFNRSLATERKLRLPFIDGQTGVAQTDCQLWHSKRDRLPISSADEQTATRTEIWQPNYGTLFSYPAIKWQTSKRREFSAMRLSMPTLQNPIKLVPDQANHLGHSSDSSPHMRHNQSGLESRLTHNGRLQDANGLPSITSTPSAAPNAPSATTTTTAASHMAAFNQAQQQNNLSIPARADSTGSHSCTTVDSDSRDLSIAASSQSNVDSPTEQLEDDHANMCSNYDSILAPTSQQQQSANIELRTTSELQNRLTSHQQHTNGSNKTNSSYADRFQSLEEQTKAAIRLQSRISKRKNSGMSLMRSNQHLHQHQPQLQLLEPTRAQQVTSPQDQINNKSMGNFSSDDRLKLEPASETTKLNGNLASHAIHDPSNSRPYVCSICDQSYKTRPGLSYHFIHTHNTTLPRNLPVKSSCPKSVGQAEQQEQQNTAETAQHQNSKTDDTDLNSAMSQEQSILVKDSQQSTKRKLKANGSQVKKSEQNRAERGQQDSSSSTDEDEGGLIANWEREQVQRKRKRSPRNSQSVARQKVCLLLEQEEDEEQITDIDERNNHLDQKSKSVDEKIDMYEIRIKPLNSEQCVITTKEGLISPDESNEKTKCVQNTFCDFCLGTSERNRRTRLPEALISCTSCGSSGHPSCLRFSDNILISVKKYNWQCIECKTCSKCKNADHEDKLLFCDDCDRSYHTYCLDPPLVELPEGNWSCQACAIEYHESSQN